MRILALRGENLASLAAPFAVEFETPAWQQQGLFAITGRTGAGKSTLLDALCLALYARIPRLERAGAAAIDGVHVHDVRTILTRGAGEGWAECEFIGNDGLPYRSRWRVWRAQKRSTGRLQPDEMQAWCLAATVPYPLGRTKTEVLRALQRALGLSFEQFCRAVLLAQGDFAAFLHATADERATLLEKLTGTECYSRVSVAAFEQAKVAQAALSNMEKALGMEAPLGEADRSALQQALTQATTQQTQLEQQWQRAIHVQQRCKDYVALRVERSKAMCAWRAAVHAWEGHRASQPVWARYLEVRPAKAAWDALQQILQQQQQQHSHHADLQAALQHHHTRLIEATTAYTSCDVRYQQCTATYTQNHAQRQQVQQYGAQRQTTAQQYHQHQQQQQHVEQQLQTARKPLDALIAQQQNLQQQYDRLWQQHQDENALAPLSAQWEWWFKPLRQHAQWLQSEKVQWQQSQQQCSDANTAAAIAVQQQQLLKELNERYEKNKTALERAQAHQRVAPLRAWYAKRAQLQDLILQQKEHDKEQIKRQQHLATKATLLTQQITLEQNLQQTQHDIDSLVQQCETQQALYDQAEAQLAQVARVVALPLAHLRQTLTDTQPCPLCGSLEHPWAGETVEEFEDLYQQQRDHTHQQRQALDCVQTLLRDKMLVREDLQAQWKALVQQLEVTQSDIDKLSAHLGELAAWNPEAHARMRWETQQQFDALAPQLQQAEWAQQQLEQAQQQFDTARACMEGARSHTVECERQADEKKHQWQHGLHDLEQLRGRLSSSAETLDPLLTPWFGQWQDVLRQDANGFFKTCVQQVERYQQRAAQLADWEAQLDTFARQRDALQQHHTALQHQLETEQLAVQKLAHSLGELDAVLMDLTQGMGALAWLELMETQVNCALQAREAALQQQQHCQQEWLALQRQCDQTQGECDALAVAVAQSRAAWQEICGRFGWDEDEVAAVLACELTGFRAWEQQLAALAERRREYDLRQALLQQQWEAWEWDEAASRIFAGIALRKFTKSVTVKTADISSRAAVATTLDLATFPLLPCRYVRTMQQGIGGRWVYWPAGALVAWRLAFTAQVVKRAWQVLTLQQRTVADLQQQWLRDEARRSHWERCAGQLQQAQGQAQRFGQLADLIGSADGKKFRTFVQTLTCDVLLVHANWHLQRLTGRYRLLRVAGSLELQVCDRVLGDALRSVHSLSGGETFILALGLALGLASLSANHVSIQSLFVDEGFGALDGETLDGVLAVLENLQAGGRRVGIISHVPALMERISWQVQVVGDGFGHSRVVTPEAHFEREQG